MRPYVVAAYRIAALFCTGIAVAWSAPALGGPIGFDRQFQEARDLALHGHRKAAIAAYTRLLERSPNNSDVLLGRGRVYSWMGNWPAAETDLQAAVKASPHYADAWSALGDMYLWSDRPKLAAKAYGRWAALVPGDPRPLLQRGRAERNAGDRKSARADFLQASKLGASPAEVSAYLASLQPIQGISTRPPDAVGRNGFPWSASVGVDYTAFPSGGLHWFDTTTTIRRHFASGSLGFEELTAHAFHINDRAWAIDDYTDLWHRAYINLRYQQGTDVLFPRTRYRAELFQGVGHGWEFSGSYDRLNFPTPIELIGISAAKYLGDWYIRWRHLYVPGTPGNPSYSNSDQVMVRDYYRGDADNYIQVTAAYGLIEEPTGFILGPAYAQHSWAASASIVQFVTPHVGFGFGLDGGYGVEDEPYSSIGAFTTLYYRW